MYIFICILLVALVETKVYQARSVRGRSLWRCLWNEFGDFLLSHTQKHENPHGFLRPIINEVVDKFLECGDLSKGFARIRCDDCAGLERVAQYIARKLNVQPLI